MIERPKAVFFGSGAIGLPTLRYLLGSSLVELTAVVTQPDRRRGRGATISAGPVKQTAAAAGIGLLQPESLRSVDAVAALAALNADLFVVMAYGQILSRKVLELPPLAALNLHASLLPRHRGASCIPAAILAGDDVTGITAMYMATALDAGDILLARSINVGATDTAGTLEAKLAALAPEVLHTALAMLLENRAPRVPQNPAGITYAPKLRKEDGQIDWGLQAHEICTRVRAFNPWPGCFTTLHRPKQPPCMFKIWEAEPAQERPAENRPGTVFTANTQGIHVACGQNTGMRILTAQIEGRKRMAAADLLRGHPVATGSVFC